VPIASWGEDIARSKERIARLARLEQAQAGTTSEFEVIRELGVTVEELSVAEEELRAQNEQLGHVQVDLERERARYHALFQRAPVPYLVTDALGVISEANAAASDLLHVPADRFVGKPLSIFVHGASRQQFRRTIAECADVSTATRTFSVTVVRRGGDVVRVEATVATSRNASTHGVEIAWLLVDQTQRLEREEQERQRAAELENLVAARTAELQRAQQLKDHLIGTVSHEFRTALGAIGGYAELLTLGIHGTLTDEQAGDVERIHRAYTHLARLVDDLLSFNKLTAGRLSLDLDDVSLADMLRGVGDLVGPQAATKGIAIVNATSEAHVIVRADPERVRQIVLNLMSNAVKFCGAGARVRIDARLRDRVALVEVSDTGPGIPLDKLDVIFEPFVRLGSETDVMGSGLGLAISREMARAMGGELTAASQMGRGTCFTLELPISTRLASATSSA
jgi:PAS domain S-box-containing protein